MRVLELELRPGVDDGGQAARRRANAVSHQRDRLGGQPGQRRHRDREIRGKTAQLGGLDELAQLTDQRQAGVDRRTERDDSGDQRPRQGPHRGEGRVEGVEGGNRRRQCPWELGHGVLEGDVLPREGPCGGVEVGDQALQGARVGVECAGHRGLRGDPVRQVVGLDTERIVRDDRRVLVRRQPVLDRGVVARAALLDANAVLAQQNLQVLARVRLQRGQNLVELDRLDPLLDRECVAVRRSRRVGRARTDVDEEVPLEEDPWTDVEGGVGVERQPLLVDRHRHVSGRTLRAVLRTRPAARQRADALHLPHVHAGDPHQRGGPKAADARERRVDRERVGEGIRELGEREIRERHHDDDPDDPGGESTDALASALASHRDYGS